MSNHTRGTKYILFNFLYVSSHNFDRISLSTGDNSLWVRTTVIEKYAFKHAFSHNGARKTITIFTKPIIYQLLSRTSLDLSALLAAHVIMRPKKSEPVWSISYEGKDCNKLIASDLHNSSPQQFFAHQTQHVYLRCYPVFLEKLHRTKKGTKKSNTFSADQTERRTSSITRREYTTDETTFEYDMAETNN